MAESPRGRSAAVGVVVALAVAAFCYGTTENLPVGLLPLISADLRTSLSSTGLLVTGYGLTVAVVSVPLTSAVVRIPRRLLLSGLLVTFVVSTWISAAASTYWMLLAARVVTALSQAVFWPVAAVTAAGVFAPELRGRAAATVFAGGSLAVVLGVPAGTWLGGQAGWRVAFLSLSGLGLLALVVIVVLMPGVVPRESGPAAGDTPDARRYWLLVVTIVLAITGFFTTQTYISTFLTRVSGFSPDRIGLLLFVQGIADSAGIACSGVVVDRSPTRAMIGSLALLAVALLGLYAFGTTPWAAVLFLTLSGFPLPGLVTALQSRVLQVAPGNADVASAGTSAAFNVGIGGGALVGGLLLPGLGVRALALAGGLLAVVALAVLAGEPLLAAGPHEGRPRLYPR
ncbi:MFS transporter [Actinoallomurus acanthiterrae]